MILGKVKRDLPLVVQSDNTILVEVDNPHYEGARDGLNRFAELVKSPEHIHTYRLTPLSLWNAASAGMTEKQILDFLEEYNKYELPPIIKTFIADHVHRYGRVKLVKSDNGALHLVVDDPAILIEMLQSEKVTPYIRNRISDREIEVDPHFRGYLKQALIKIGYPVEDLAGYTKGAPLKISLRKMTLSGKPFNLRHYQRDAVAAFYAGGSIKGGSGVIVLPCGAGKTMVGLGVMEKLQAQTLILATTTVAVRQWIEELLDKTTLTKQDIGEYTGDKKQIKPVTISSYHILTHRKRKEQGFKHFEIFNTRDWGLIIYDEVHIVPAPIFRITAEIQTRRRLGLTATLIREDGREDEVFSLIGPKHYDVPWKVLESQGWIANAICHEIRISMPTDTRLDYVAARKKSKFRIASENIRKLTYMQHIIERHRGDRVLIIGQYIAQLKETAKLLKAPLITGATPNARREQLYNRFRRGEIRLLVVSKVANFAIDLPDANVAIQISGTFGSRQEEAQRLGRVLRPKSDASPAYFYTLVSKDTTEQQFAMKRQLFLTEQGYKYLIMDENQFMECQKQ